MTLEPGQILSRYRLVEKIGEGGMGVVWKALDTELNRHVAVKILPQELTADAERRLRFKREARTAASLSHPNIAVIHEAGEHGGTPFLVMELVEGKNLRARTAYEAAREILEGEVQARPDDHWPHAYLGLALAGLGRREEAIRRGTRAVELCPISEDAWGCPDTLLKLALIYTRLGEHEAALDELERLLSIPSESSIQYVRLNPLYRPLLDHPRFEELERRFGGDPAQ